LGVFLFTALSLFSGIGGFCLGVKKAGFSIQGAVELDSHAANNYRLNFPEIPLFQENIEQFLPKNDAEKFESHFSQYVRTDELDLLFGGPPCQGFSQIGPREVKDPRNKMYLSVCRLARQLNPKLVLIENVPNMLLMKDGHFKSNILSSLAKSGYDNIAVKVLNAADFGVPQERKRVFILAARQGLVRFELQSLFDSLAESLKCDAITVHEAIGDLPKVVAPESGIALPYPGSAAANSFLTEMRLDCDGKVYGRDEKRQQYLGIDKSLALHNHHTKEMLERRSRLIRLLKPGKKANSLPKHIWNRARPEKWRRLDGARQSHTILAQMHRDLSEWVHYRHHRWITVREAMRLQSFHDGIVLSGSEWQQLKQVGNAVPPLLARVAALAASEALDQKRRTQCIRRTVARNKIVKTEATI
jgi:DNA (cytosine-5)-methyltransferase 1